MAAPTAFFLGVCAVLLAAAAANAEAASVVVGLAKCAGCTRKDIKAEEAFRRLRVAIKCRNAHGEYESKAVGGLDRTGAFSVPLAADLHGADCVAQLHSAASDAPCPGQEPSKVVPVSEGATTFGVVPGAKTAATPSAASPECASAFCPSTGRDIGSKGRGGGHHKKKHNPHKPETKALP
ncbi:hypothetical protein ACQJBY_013783 [Aegilops geniculata]